MATFYPIKNTHMRFFDRIGKCEHVLLIDFNF